MKKLYKKTKTKAKELLRLPSGQSVPASPARSARGSQDASSDHERESSAVPPTAVDASQPAVVQIPSDATSAETRGREVPAHEPSPPTDTIPHSAPAYTQPPSSHSKLVTAGSICNDLLTVVHGASDAFPPLKSALGGILEIWKQCERTAEADDEFGKLKSKLEALLKVAAKTPRGPSTTNLSIRLQSLSNDICQLRDSVDNKLVRGRVAKAAQSRIDIGDIRTLADAISSILDVFHLENGIVVEIKVGETAQDVKEHRAEWRADKAERQEKEQSEKSERQEKEKLEQAERQKKELTETIAAALKERHVPQAVYDAQSNPGCMEKTRVRILNEIDAWIKDPDAQKICWITGMAGTGKTTITKTVCERASANPDIVLGGSFFCSRTGVAAQREIRSVIPTLVQLLARQSIPFSRALAEEIANDQDLQHKHVTVQVKQLLYTPLIALKDSKTSVVFVIDALDECGDAISDLNEVSHQAVSEMLEALVTSAPSAVKLPVKFLVTSRPETHIRETPVSDADFSQILRLHAVNKEEVNVDIGRYITETLNTRLVGKQDVRAYFTATVVDDLVRLCDGLFIVAATALKHTFSAGANVAEARFQKLLNDSRDGFNSSAAAPLDRMYKIILEDAATEDAAEMSGLLRLLASLLSARMAFSVTALADILGQKPSDVRASMSRLHAVVDVPDDDHVPGLRTVHASFGDYLFDRAPAQIRIPRFLGHSTLAQGCLNVMRDRLHFNISHSASSYVPNSSTRPTSITLSLEYACLHWAHHAVGSKPHDNSAFISTSLDIIIGQVFRPKFLFWLEVLSVLRKVGLAHRLLLSVVSAVEDSLLLQFLSEAKSFVASSHEAIERSASHIYVSAIAFADKSSLIYKDFASCCSGLVQVDLFGIGHHSGRVMMTLSGRGGPVRSVAYSGDGQLLASGSDDGTVRIWDIQKGEEAQPSLQSGDGRVLSVDFARNNPWVASGTENGTVCVWNVGLTRASHRRFNGHSGQVNSVAFSRDSSRLASASEDKTARIWNSETGEQLRILSAHTTGINGVTFAPDDLTVGTSSKGGNIQLWDVLTGQAVPKRLGYEADKTVGFSPDGEMVAGSTGGQVVLCSCKTGVGIALLNSDTSINSIRFSPDGQSLVAAHNRGVRLWTLQPNPNSASWVELGGHIVHCAAFSPDGLHIASAADDGTIRILSAGSGQSVVQRLPAHDKAVNSVAVSRGGDIIVSGSDDRPVRVWNAHTGGAVLSKLDGHIILALSVSVSSDGRFIASALADYTVRLWDLQSGAAIGEPMRGHNWVRAVTFSNDGHWLASASDDKSVQMWAVATQQASAVGPFQCGEAAYTVAFSPDDGLVTAAGHGGRIYFWRTASGERAHEPLHANNHTVWSVAFSPDGTRIVSGGSDNAARIWDIAAGQCILVLQGHTSYVWSVAWSLDARVIATGSGDATLRLWDAMTGAPLATLHGHAKGVQSVVFTNDSQFIVSGSEDTTIRKWDVRAACQLPSERRNDPVAALSSATLKDGWLLGSSGELILWVPAEYRGCLQAALYTLVIGRSRVVVSVGDGGLHTGLDWALCWRG